MSDPNNLELKINIIQKQKTLELIDRVVKEKLIHFVDGNREFFVNRWKKATDDYVKIAWKMLMFDETEQYIIGFGSDITDFLIENPYSAPLINKVVTMCSDGIVITDAQNTNNVIIYANRAFEKITGYAISELVGENCRMLQAPNTIQESKNTIRNAVKKGESCNVLIKNKRKNGDIYYSHLALSPIIENDVIINWVGIVKDCTQEVLNGTLTWSPTSTRGFCTSEK